MMLICRDPEQNSHAQYGKCSQHNRDTMRKIKEKLLEEVKQTDRSLVVKVFMASSMILTNRSNNPMHNNPMYNKHSKVMLSSARVPGLQYIGSDTTPQFDGRGIESTLEYIMVDENGPV